MKIKKVTDHPVHMDLKDYDIPTKIMEGTELWFVLRNLKDDRHNKVFEFTNVAAFADRLHEAGELRVMVISEPKSEYAAHVAKELKRPEVKGYREIHVFDKSKSDSCFRVVAEKYEMRQFTDEDKWLIERPN